MDAIPQKKRSSKLGGTNEGKRSSGYALPCITNSLQCNPILERSFLSCYYKQMFLLGSSLIVVGIALGEKWYGNIQVIYAGVLVGLEFESLTERNGMGDIRVIIAEFLYH